MNRDEMDALLEEHALAALRSLIRMTRVICCVVILSAIWTAAYVTGSIMVHPAGAGLALLMLTLFNNVTARKSDTKELVERL